MDPLVSPHTLSAAMKVDSAFVSSLLPLIQCNLSASLVQIRLVNHISCLGNGNTICLHTMLHMVIVIDLALYFLWFVDKQ